MKWFRLYSEVIHDPKVQRMPLAMRWRWLELLCMANDQEPRGLLPSTDDIAYILRISRKAAAESVAYLIDKGLLDADSSGNVRPHNWMGRQPTSDDAAERMANKRRTSSEQVLPRLDKTRTEQNREEVEAEQSGVPSGTVPLVRAFERCFGRLLTHTEIELIHALSEEHQRDRIDYALREAAEANARNVRYVKAVCETQATNGDKRDGGRASTNNRPVAAEPQDAYSVYGKPKPELILDVD